MANRILDILRRFPGSLTAGSLVPRPQRPSNGPSPDVMNRLFPQQQQRFSVKPIGEQQRTPLKLKLESPKKPQLKTKGKGVVKSKGSRVPGTEVYK